MIAAKHPGFITSNCGCVHQGSQVKLFMNPYDDVHPDKNNMETLKQSEYIHTLNQHFTLYERADLSVRTTGLFSEGIENHTHNRILDRDDPMYNQRKPSLLTSVREHPLDIATVKERASAVDTRARENTKNLYHNSNKKHGTVFDQPAVPTLGFQNTDLMMNPGILKAINAKFGNAQQQEALRLLKLKC